MTNLPGLLRILGRIEDCLFPLHSSLNHKRAEVPEHLPICSDCSASQKTKKIPPEHKKEQWNDHKMKESAIIFQATSR